MPGRQLETLGDNTTVWGAVFAEFWLYLVVQGYPVSHGEIASSSSNNLDNIVSALPALFGVSIGQVQPCDRGDDAAGRHLRLMRPWRRRLED